MEIIINKKINLEMESTRYLFNIANDIDVNDVVDQLSQNCSLTSKQVIDNTRFLIRLTSKINKLKLDLDIINFFYENNDDLDFTLGQCSDDLLIKDPQYFDKIGRPHV